MNIAKNIRSLLIASLAATGLLLPAARGAALGADGATAEVEALSREQTDKLLDDIFSRLRKLERAEAEYIKTTIGGVRRRKRIIYAGIKFESPNKFFFLNREKSLKALPATQCTLIIFDGHHLWELPAAVEGEKNRRATRRRAESVEKEGGKVDLASFLLGREVATAGELRDDFDIRAVLEDKGKPSQKHHFILAPKRDATRIEFWIKPGETLPGKWKTTTETESALTGKKRIRIEEVELKNVRTNLNGLPPFPLTAFIFPLAPDIEVTQMPEDEVLSPAALKKELRELQDRWAAERKSRPGGQSPDAKIQSSKSRVAPEP